MIVRVPSTFEIHGHRGARGRYPENTIAGFIAALADGADTLETDLLMTSDGVVVIHHNVEPNPDTTRDETGRWLEQPGRPLITTTCAELARYDIGRLRPGSEYAQKFPHQVGQDGVRIPTLDAALIELDRVSARRVRWNLEIKIAMDQPERTAPPEAVADATVAVVRARGLVGRTMIQSFDWRVVQRVHAIAPEIPTGCLTAPDTMRPLCNAGLELAAFGGSVPRLAHAAGARYWTPDFKMLGQGDVEEAHRLGLRVVPWTVNEPDDLARVVSLGVDGVITDYPDRVGRTT